MVASLNISFLHSRKKIWSEFYFFNIISVSTIIAGIIWIWGICKRKNGLLAASIACFTLPLFIFLFGIIIYVCIKFSDDRSSLDEPTKKDGLAKYFENSTEILAFSVIGKLTLKRFIISFLVFDNMFLILNFLVNFRIVHAFLLLAFIMLYQNQSSQ